MGEPVLSNGIPVVEVFSFPSQAEIDAMNEATFRAIAEAQDQLDAEKAAVSDWLLTLADNFEMRERALALVDMVYYD